jgi:hypothetical protein
MKRKFDFVGGRNREDEGAHDRNKRIKSERDRRLRKALTHPRYFGEGDTWER